MPDAATSNRLASETSPYLRQHANNPVHWYPWGPEALALARKQCRPILLSIGYSACHWCHVMAHESFEDQATADVMNRLFINIKVDREERPDLDRIYQLAHQLLTGRAGGWPLTVVLTPDQVPFFAGTYFPCESRPGLPAFRQLLSHIAEVLEQQPDQVQTQNEALLRALASVEESQEETDEAPNPTAAQLARDTLAASYDHRHGGFGAAPKFPHPTTLEFLLRHWAGGARRGQPDREALEMVRRSVLAMVAGGINDQLGGGFSRYSVDQQWLIPHFEKMLYDNGPLLALCAELWGITGDQRFAGAAHATAAWVVREMQSPEGGYYASLDADSEGHEGRFYVWDREEVRQCLEPEEFTLVSRRYGLDRPPNFEGHWHLFASVDEATVASEQGWEPERVRSTLESARHKLLQRRRARVAPARDDKVLTAWNALMIRGMATASRHLQEPAWAESARHALNFIRTRLWDGQRLLAVYKDGTAKLPAYLDDHAYLIEALLELAQCGWVDSDLEFARALADRLLAGFEDSEAGGFHFTAVDHERLIHRPKPTFDDATPCGNAVAANSLLQLGHLLGEARYLAAAERALRWAWPQIYRTPAAHTGYLRALDEWLQPGQIIVIRGEPDAIRDWQQRATTPFAPGRLSLAIPTGAATTGLLEERKSRCGCVAYLCTGTVCSVPISERPLLEAALAEWEPSPNSSPG